MNAFEILALAIAVIVGFAGARFTPSKSSQDVPLNEASKPDDVATFAALMSGFNVPAIESYQVQSALTNPGVNSQNMAAFLSMLAMAEGTNRGGDPYRVCYGYVHTVRDLAQHPATGREPEWRGEYLPNHMCAAVGMSPGCVSTAAGRYQIIRPTWLKCQAALNLPDFTAASQDAAAVYLIKKRGALDDVQNGNIEAAIQKCSKEWASLPGANYGQPERKMSALVEGFTNNGGVLA